MEIKGPENLEVLNNITSLEELTEDSEIEKKPKEDEDEYDLSQPEEDVDDVFKPEGDGDE